MKVSSIDTLRIEEFPNLLLVEVKTDSGLIGLGETFYGPASAEANKVSSMAEIWHLPIAFHDCTGPVTLTASTHLALANTNCYIQEMVRAFYYGWYDNLVTALPPVKNGFITVPDGNGLGLSLNEDVYKRKDIHIKSSKN